MLSRILRFTSAVTALSLCQAVAGGQGTENSSSEEKRPGTVIRLDNVSVTPVDGPSWLKHLGRAFDETSMGKTGSLGPAPGRRRRGGPQWNPALADDLLTQSMVLSGADLYRLDCQGCHKANGKGLPPEINSIVDPVQATSPELIVQRMKKAGAPISWAIAKQLASQAETSLLQRIDHGGQSMPPFPHLNEVEVRALVAYLNQLAGVPGARGRQIHVQEPVVRVGEHLVKGTCHICHSATGSNPSPQQLMQGAIPPLAVLTTRLTLPQFFRKVTTGAPITMGTLRLQYRGRMPVFSYLSENEVAAAYLYLTLYPPHDVASTNYGNGTLQQCHNSIFGK